MSALKMLPSIVETDQPLLSKPLRRQKTTQCLGAGHPPCTSACARHPHHQPLVETERPQVTHARPNAEPRFPDTGSYAMAYPPIQFPQNTRRLRQPKVRHPAEHVLAHHRQPFAK